MKVFRFMSKSEFDKFMNGEVLVNNTDHKNNYAYSNSVGFCFLDYDEYSPGYAIQFLGGIVSNEVCAVFITDKSNLKLSESNRYADPYGCFFDTIYADEYCTKSYDNTKFKLIETLDVNKL